VETFNDETPLGKRFLKSHAAAMRTPSSRNRGCAMGRRFLQLVPEDQFRREGGRFKCVREKDISDDQDIDD
jgi:hypothetical protein